MTTGYNEKRYNIDVTEDARYAARTAERAAKRAAAEAKRHTADMCILLAAAAIAVLVFIVCGSIAAASRGFVFGVGGAYSDYNTSDIRQNNSLPFNIAFPTSFISS